MTRGREQTLFAVVDQGSTSTKGALTSLDGHRVAEVERPVETRHQGDRVLHDPAALAAGVESVLEELLTAGEPRAVGLTCQRSTCLLWSRESGSPLTPARSWQDTAESGTLDSLAEHHAEIRRRTGLRPSPHYAAAKLAALLEELPDGRRRAEEGEVVAGTLDAFLVRRLTGAESTEPGHAGRTLLYNLERGGWDLRLAELFGVPLAALPPIRPSGGFRGEVQGVPLTALAGDQQAALLGHGGWAPGVTAAHFGTGAFVLSSTGSEPLRSDGLLTAVLAETSDQRRFQLEGSVNSAGAAVDWACRLTGERIEEWSGAGLQLDALPLVMPSFAGAAAPHWVPGARGVVAGLDLTMTGRELVGGTLCGVAMRVLDCVEALREAGAAGQGLRVSGKLTRVDAVVALLANAGQQVVQVAPGEETGLAGIARLAAAGLGEDEGPLAAPVPAGIERQPRWPSNRAAALRARWREFAGRALGLPSRFA